MSRQDFRTRPPALVLGRPNANLLGQARALGRQGIRVFAILTRGEPPIIARVSRYIDRLVVLQNAPDDDIVDAVRRLSEEAGTRPVLFFGGDYDITLAARLWPRIDSLVIPVTPPEEAARFNDKALQVKTVTAAGVSAPQTNVVESSADIRRIQSELSFPLICRPVELARKGDFAGKMFIASDGDELQRRLAPVLREGGKGEVMVQEYISGTNDQLYFALASCDDSGSVESMVTGRKLYEYPEGLMCIGETVSNPALTEAAEKVFQAFSLPGVLGVEFKYDQERGCFWFIEVNFRPENILAIAECSGANIVFHAYLRAIGQSGCYLQPEKPRDAVWRDVSLVILSRLSGQSPPKLKHQGRNIVDAYWVWSDPMPALAWYLVKVWRVCRGRFR